jgi:hypothetical protein
VTVGATDALTDPDGCADRAGGRTGEAGGYVGDAGWIRVSKADERSTR